MGCYHNKLSFFDSFSYSKTINLPRNKTLCRQTLFVPSLSALLKLHHHILYIKRHLLFYFMKLSSHSSASLYCSNFFLCLNLWNHKEEVYNKSLCVGIAAKTKLTDGFNGDSDWWNKHTPRDGALHLLPLKTALRFLQPFFIDLSGKKDFDWIRSGTLCLASWSMYGQSSKLQSSFSPFLFSNTFKNNKWLWFCGQLNEWLFHLFTSRWYMNNIFRCCNV